MKAYRALAGSAVIYIVTAGLSAGVPLILLPILTRLLTPDEYGKVAMFSVVVQALGAVTGLSVHGAVGMRYFDRERLDFPRYVASCLAILVASTSVVLLLVLLGLPWLAEFTKLPRHWLILAVLLSCSGFIVQVQLSIWQSSRQAWKFGALRLFQALLDLLLSLLLIIVAGWAWNGRIAALAIAGLAAGGLAIVTLFYGGWLRLPIEKSYVRGALQFGVPLVPHAIGGMLIALVDRFMISNVLDVGSTGVYTVALQIGLLLNLVNDSLSRAYSPRLIDALKENNAARDRMIVRFTYGYFLAVFVVGAVLGLLAPVILTALVGSKFQGASSIVIFITLGQAFSGMYYMVATYVFYAGRTAQLAVVTLLCGVLNVAVSYWLLNLRGLEGAGIAFMIAQFFLFVGTWWLADRARPMPWLGALIRT